MAQMYAKRFIYFSKIKYCRPRIRENDALNSHARFADLLDIILRWNMSYEERRQIGSKGE